MSKMTATDTVTGLSATLQVPVPPVSAALGSKGIIGATVTPSDYPGSGTWPVAAQTYESYVGKTPMALAMQKRYHTPGQWFTSVPLSISQLPSTTRYLISMKPGGVAGGGPPNLTAAEQTNLANQLTLYKNHGIDFDVTLWQEPEGPTTFPTGPDYQAYVAYYGPIVKDAGIKLVFDPVCYNTANTLTYYPGDALCDVICVDYYCLAFTVQGQDPTHLDPLIALADNHKDANGNPDPIPFGWGEFGATASSNPMTLTAADYQTYGDWIVSKMTGRINAGLNNYAMLYFNSPGQVGSENTVTGASDIKVPFIQNVFTNLSSLA